jgi:hypothetical protein
MPTKNGLPSAAFSHSAPAFRQARSVMKKSHPFEIPYPSRALIRLNRITKTKTMRGLNSSEQKKVPQKPIFVFRPTKATKMESNIQPMVPTTNTEFISGVDF